MPTLAELQAAFADHVAGEDRDDLLSVVAGNSISAAARLRIHRNHVRQSLAAALAATFPTIALLVGAEFFGSLAKAYAKENLPEQPVLAEYGAGFPAFIGSFAPARPLAYLADVARLDWALNCAFHAPEVPRLATADLATLPPEQLVELRLSLVPGTTIVRSTYPLDRIWYASQPGAMLCEMSSDDVGAVLLVMRQSDDAAFVPLDPAEAVFIEAIVDGLQLGEAAQLAIDAFPLFDLARSFGRLLALFVFARI